jgi:ABC-type Fe3+-hydroxamate transport system substrate-binding protein
MASWLARTAVAADDLHIHLEAVPRGRIYEVVDECRRRARTWAEIADALEKQARARRGPPSE